MLLYNVQGLVCFPRLTKAFAFTNAITISWVVKLATREAAVSTQFDFYQKAGSFRFPQKSEATTSQLQNFVKEMEGDPKKMKNSTKNHLVKSE